MEDKNNRPQPVVISAETARQLTEKKLKLLRETELANIFEEIHNAIEDGNYDITISSIISEETTKKLKELGYKVEEQVWIAERTTNISWGDEEDG